MVSGGRDINDEDQDVMMLDWILCHWVSRTAAEVKTCEQELITELPTVRVIEVLWEHTTLFRTQFEERTVRSVVMTLL